MYKNDMEEQSLLKPDIVALKMIHSHFAERLNDNIMNWKLDKFVKSFLCSSTRRIICCYKNLTMVCYLLSTKLFHDINTFLLMCTSYINLFLNYYYILNCNNSWKLQNEPVKYTYCTVTQVWLLVDISVCMNAQVRVKQWWSHSSAESLWRHIWVKSLSLLSDASLNTCKHFNFYRQITHVIQTGLF